MNGDDQAGWEAMEDRRDQRRRALGHMNPQCSEPGCTETDPLALAGAHPEILCYEHDALRKGRSWLEGHHLAGQANDPITAEMPGNDHRAISERQNELWSRETLRNPDGSPLLMSSAAIRGWLDVLWVVLERTITWIPGFLERLDEWLCEEIGPRWWESFSGGDEK
jgi:hypothetical protein